LRKGAAGVSVSGRPCLCVHALGIAAVL
jgi:hypothetical protein